MATETETILQQKHDELRAHVRKAWIGREREAVTEIVRSADLAAFVSRFMPLEHEAQVRQRSILSGVAPALATFLPELSSSGSGLPFGPSSAAMVGWIDGMLQEFGKIAELQRLAAMERFSLTRSQRIDERTLRIEVESDVADAMDREAWHWHSAQLARRIAELQGPPPEPAIVTDLLDRTSGVHDGWFIRYEGHEDLIEFYRERAFVEVLTCGESEALAHDAFIGGRMFAEWRAVCVAALGRVLNHIAYATRLRHRNPHLDLRNLLTVPVLKKDAEDVWLETGDMPERVCEAISHLTLDSDSVAPWQQHHEIPTPFYVDAGGGWFLLPMFGGLLNPICGLVRTLQLRHRREWDTAVEARESYFRSDLRNRFNAPRFIVPDRGYVLRRSDRSHITDVDAVILDRQTGTLALVQLKWPDMFGLSPRERESRRRNLLGAGDWIAKVDAWVDGRRSGDISKALNLGYDAGDRPPLLMVVARYNARFTLNDRLDDRAAWVSWPELLRTFSTEGDLSDPLVEIFRRFRAGGDLPSDDLAQERLYSLHDLDVHVCVSGAHTSESESGIA